MGDSSTCLLHGFSYASAIPNEYKQGNRIHILGESISFGRFTSESLTFSHKKYVEEAERYAQPGSVAQKKAFFEAHYKRIAALKAAAAAAALSDHQNDINNNSENVDERILLNSHSNADVENEDEQVKIINEHTSLAGNGVSNLENQDTISVSETSESTQMERPLLKKENTVDCEEVTSKRRSSPSSLKTSILQKTWRVPSTPPVHVEAKRSSPTSLRDLLNLVQSDKQATKIAHKDCSTPASTKSASTNTRMKTPIDSSAPATGRKTSAPKWEWHILSAVCPKSLSSYRNKLLHSPTVSTPFTLRTQQRAPTRKQKLEEKFNSTEEAQKMQTQTTLKEKAGNEFRKLSCSLCFKPRPLPDFYKEKTETPNNHMKKKTPTAAKTQAKVLGRSISSKKRGTVSMPPPPPPPTCLAKNTAVYKNLSQKNVLNQRRSLHERIAHENASPNIQH